MCSGSGAPGISTTFRGKSGMSDTVALLTLARRDSISTPDGRAGVPPSGYSVTRGWESTRGPRGPGYRRRARHPRRDGPPPRPPRPPRRPRRRARRTAARRARVVAGAGAAAAVGARAGDEIGAVAREISSAGGEALPVYLDVTDEDSVAAAFERTRAAFGPVDVLINNAGAPGVPLPVSQTEFSDWRRVFDVNVTGAFLCAREAIPRMASAQWGRIVNVSSAAARHPMAGMAAYGASKAALDQLTRVLALEGEPHNVAVTGVYPGVIDTRMQEESRTFGPDLIGKRLHRMFNGYRDYGILRRPEEPAELISYPCTPAAAPP